MKWWIIIGIIVVISTLMLIYRKNIIRKIKTLQSPYKYFTYDEFDSPNELGSGETYMDKEFIRKLDIARSCANFPFKIVSGYRTQEHNKKVGGVSDSSHTKGLGVDIDYTTEEELNTILRCLTKVGFNRFVFCMTKSSLYNLVSLSISYLSKFILAKILVTFAGILTSFKTSSTSFSVGFNKVVNIFKGGK